jgi:hypothetical protein
MAIKTEHAGAKNGGGFWGTRADAKQVSNKLRRDCAKAETSEGMEDHEE